MEAWICDKQLAISIINYANEIYYRHNDIKVKIYNRNITYNGHYITVDTVALKEMLAKMTKRKYNSCVGER